MNDSSNLPAKYQLTSLQIANKQIAITDKLLAQIKEQSLAINDFLEDYILKLPYGLNEQYFYNGQHNAFSTQDKVFPYLLPIKRTCFEYFPIEDLSKFLSFEIKESRKAGERITVQLRIPSQKGGLNFEKTYFQQMLDLPRAKLNEQNGEIINCKMGLGIFPFFRVLNRPDYNNYYKLMLVDVDDREDLLNEEYDLKFFTKHYEITENIKKNNRRSKKEELIGSSTYYEINHSFDLIEVYPQKINRKAIRGLIVPKWQQISFGAKESSFAIDLNSSYTHVAYANDIAAMPRPLDIGENDLQVIMLNKPAEVEPDNLGLTAAKYTRGLSNIRETLILQEREFIPSIIGKKFGSNFYFPLRTAISETENFDNELTVLLGNINIAFSFEKERLDRKAPVKVNLKWSAKFDSKEKEKVEAYIKELLLLIKHKIILNNSNPAQTRVTWFYPLNICYDDLEQLKGIWQKAFQTVFNNQGTLRHMCEVVSPDCFLRRTNQLIALEETVTIYVNESITDILLTENQKPKYGTSFNFGSNVIWGTGFNSQKYDKSNGFLKAFKKQAQKDAASTRKSSNGDNANIEEYYNDLIHYGSDEEVTLSSAEIIRFLFKYDEEARPELKFGDFIRNDKHLKLILLLHYSAIIFHTAQYIRYIKQHQNSSIKIPRYLIFSGNGSLYINALGGANGKGIRIVTRYILETVCSNLGLTFPANFELVLTREPLEEIANGGVLAKDDDYNYTINKINLVGVEDHSNIRQVAVYGDITGEIEESVLRNGINLINIILDNPDLNLKNYFGIDTDLDLVRATLKKHFRDGLQEGLGFVVEYNSPLEETLFFYPFIYSLNQLSKGDGKLNCVR